MQQNKNKIVLTTIGIDHSTNRQIDKLCKRYNLKKGEIVKLAFEYMDKACINPSEPPESVKTELASGFTRNLHTSATLRVVFPAKALPYSFFP